MCDNLYLRRDGAAVFGKNSDREPTEPQVLLSLPRIRGDRRRFVRATWIDVPEVPDRHAVILSVPVWMWGAEMGANEHGLVIGNTAVFTVTQTRRPALLGMDLVRLALERAADADEALDVITGLLERYGQGGSCGFRHRRFHYDNSFVIADHRGAWLLETAGRAWVARWSTTGAATSNLLTIDEDFDRCHPELLRLARDDGRYEGGAFSFRRAFGLQLVSRLAGAMKRYEHDCDWLAGGSPNPRDMARQLRSHGAAGDCGAAADGAVCAHARGPGRSTQTTAALIAEWTGNEFSVWGTGTPAPCLSVFRRLRFNTGAPAGGGPAARDIRPWIEHWHLQRRLLVDTDARRAFRSQREKLEAAIFANGPTTDEEIVAWLNGWYASGTMASRRPIENRRLARYWERLALLGFNARRPFRA
ncbi:MAG: peptidase family C69 [Candidatus Dadabacteria bacterium]|nr:MAG: peptidase family C69 [Candidatus Dadabacteria bacterium]